MDTVPIPDELKENIEDVESHLKSLREKYSNLMMSIHGQSIIIAPSNSYVKAMVESLLRVLRNSIPTEITHLILFNGPICNAVVEEVEKISKGHGVQYVIKKRGIQLTGKKKSVDIVKDHCEFLKSINLPQQSPVLNTTIANSLSDRSRDEFGRFRSDFTPKKPKRKIHRCPFCHKMKDSGSFRGHVVEHCSKASNKLQTTKLRHRAVDKYYYKLKFVDTMEIELCDLESSDEEPNKMPVPLARYSTSDSRVTENVDQFHSFALESAMQSMDIRQMINRFSSYSHSSFSGKKKHHKDSTKKAKLAALEKVVSIANVKVVYDLCGSMDSVMTAIENQPIENSGKYKLVEAVIDLLKYVKLEEAMSSDEQLNLGVFIERWDRGRQCFQHGLVADRVVKKKQATDDIQQGKYPTLGEVQMFCDWLYKEQPFDTTRRMNRFQLEIFYAFVASNLVLSTIIRPGSFCNMEVTEFINAVCKKRQNQFIYLVRVYECKASRSNAGFVLFPSELYQLCKAFINVRPQSTSQYLFVDNDGNQLDTAKILKWCQKHWNCWRKTKKMVPKIFGFTKLRKAAHTKHAGHNGFGDVVFALGAGHRYYNLCSSLLSYIGFLL